MADKLTTEQRQDTNEQLKKKAALQINNVIGRKLAEKGEKGEKMICWLYTTDTGATYARALHDVSHSERRSLMEFERVERHYDGCQPLNTELPRLSETDQWIKDTQERRRRRR